MNKNVIIAVLAIAFAVSTVCALNRQSNDDTEIAQMSGEIKACEDEITQLDSLFSFMDTVGEGDDYCYLVEAHENFLSTDNIELCRAYYKEYMRYYNKVFNQSIDLIKKKAVHDYVDSLPVHNCDRE